MSLVISGNPFNSTTPLVATVNAIADNGGGEMRVTTAAPHLFGDGDFVHVILTLPLDAYFFIVVIDSVTFDLVASTFTATATGTAVDVSLTPQIQFPTDGDSFSLQLSGMLSGLQAVADRTQALRLSQITHEATFGILAASGSIPIPPWCTVFWVQGFGGGGGGGGGSGGYTGNQSIQLAAGGGGAGARLAGKLYFPFAATQLDVVIGTGGTSGGGGSVPGGSGTNGGDGNPTTVTYHDGVFSGITFASLIGGAGGGGGTGLIPVGTNIGAVANVPAFTPGGVGPAGLFRGGPRSQLSPGPRQIQNILNASGTLSSLAGGWPVGVYDDPVGQMEYHEGGASVANGGNGTYLGAVSYNGAPSPEGVLGGVAGANGANGTPSSWLCGIAGGGGGAGPVGPGGAGGNGGDGSATSATTGTIGTGAAANSGGGGGGGGGGGNGGTAGAAGLSGGPGGSGLLSVVFFGFTVIP